MSVKYGDEIRIKNDWYIVDSFYGDEIAAINEETSERTTVLFSEIDEISHK